MGTNKENVKDQCKMYGIISQKGKQLRLKEEGNEIGRKDISKSVLRKKGE